MAVQAGKYLGIDSVSGQPSQVAAATTATANTVIGSDANGRINLNQLPTGVGAEVTSAITVGTLSAGNFVNLYSNTGVWSARQADCTTPLEAHGFVLAGTTVGQTATVYLLGSQNSAVTGLTIGSMYFLSTTGGTTVTAPSAAGNIVQRLGLASTATNLVFEPSVPITLA